MKRKRLYAGLIVLGTAVVVATAISLISVTTAGAQCGSQASSCKNCHETQGKDPVNTDGTGWHQSHAFGDFCYTCHGGNNQATDETAAHAGMVAPLSDVQAACAQCHPNDLQARAEVYAKVLGVQVGMGGSAPSAATSAAPTAAAPEAVQAQPAAAVPAGPVDQADLVDYVKRYDENALGRYPTNWGNVILWIMLIAMLLGGGALVLIREKLVRVIFQETKPVEGQYPPDVVELVPDLAKLKPASRKTLGRLIKQPDAGKLLDAVEMLRGESKEDKAE